MNCEQSSSICIYIYMYMERWTEGEVEKERKKEERKGGRKGEREKGGQGDGIVSRSPALLSSFSAPHNLCMCVLSPAKLYREQNLMLNTHFTHLSPSHPPSLLPSPSPLIFLHSEILALSYETLSGLSPANQCTEPHVTSASTHTHTSCSTHFFHCLDILSALWDVVLELGVTGRTKVIFNFFQELFNGL